MLKGIISSEGIGIGKAFILPQNEIIAPRFAVTDVEEQGKLFAWATMEFITYMITASAVVFKRAGKSASEILLVQVAIVQDPELERAVLEVVNKSRVNVEFAISQVCDGYISLFTALKDPFLKARAADFCDIKNRLLEILLGKNAANLGQIAPGSVLVSKDISPSHIATLMPESIEAIATQDGSVHSHLSILARYLRVPSVVMVGNLLQHVRPGDTLVVDGFSGTVVCSPTARQVENYCTMKTCSKVPYVRNKAIAI